MFVIISPTAKIINIPTRIWWIAVKQITLYRFGDSYSEILRLKNPCFLNRFGTVFNLITYFSYISLRKTIWFLTKWNIPKPFF